METTETKHSPLPWVVNHFIGESSIYCPATKQGIAKFKNVQFDYSIDIVQANAELIVRSVNAHGYLLDALKSVLNNVDGNGNVTLSKHGKVLAEIRAAISKAEQKVKD